MLDLIPVLKRLAYFNGDVRAILKDSFEQGNTNLDEIIDRI